MENQTLPFPRYPSIVLTALSVIASRIINRKRSFRAEALRLTSRITPPVIVEGIENLPASGGFLVVVNHYARPGFSTAWISLAISAVIPVETTWIMSEAWAFTGNSFGFILRPLMRFILASINQVYGFLSMPSMVEGFNTPLSRAAGVRRAVEFARAHPQVVIGLAPEGQDSPLQGVGLAPAGAGKFMGFPILLAAVSESSGQFTVKFGPPFNLPSDSHIPREQVDEFIRLLVREAMLVQYNSIK
jgi:1-acyl-sn-glycerol-3-phosphate acyltransferase